MKTVNCDWLPTGALVSQTCELHGCTSFQQVRWSHRLVYFTAVLFPFGSAILTLASYSSPLSRLIPFWYLNRLLTATIAYGARAPSKFNTRAQTTPQDAFYLSFPTYRGPVRFTTTPRYVRPALAKKKYILFLLLIILLQGLRSFYFPLLFVPGHMWGGW